MVVAIDNLASINSSFGFEVGDETIVEVDRIVAATLDRPQTIARYASNRLGIVIEPRDRSEAQRLAAELVRAVRGARIEISACRIAPSISIGLAMLPEHGANPAEALRNALSALDEATKQTVSLVTYEASLDARKAYQQNVTLITEVMKGLEEERMRFVLQPIFNARTGSAELYECLLRLSKEDGSIISAGEFMEITEQLGLAHEIDSHTLKLAVALLAEQPSLCVSLNVSQHTAKDEAWLELLRTLIGNRADMAQRLMIEITETALMGNLTLMASFVDQLRALGCRVALDDFGTGFTSLRQVTHLKLDMIKIDGTFVKGLPDDLQSAAFIRSAVEIARSFGLKTVAEWVDSEEAASFLKDAGIDYLQGFLYGRPISPDALRL